MIHATRAAVRKWLDVLLHIHDSPQRTAAAFALGVFFGFSPFLGLHTILALACAFVFGLNRVAVLVGVYSNLPWILAPYYATATLGGAEVLGTRLQPGFRQQLYRLFELSLWQGDFWRKLVTLMRPLLWPYTIGSLVGAVILAAVAYKVALAFVIAQRRHHHHFLRHGGGAAPK
jgi:uncharacterized protein